MGSWQWVDSAADDKRWLFELRKRNLDQYSSITAAMWRVAHGDQPHRPCPGALNLNLCEAIEPPIGLVYARWQPPGAPVEELRICLVSSNGGTGSLPPTEYREAETRWLAWRAKQKP